MENSQTTSGLNSYTHLKELLLTLLNEVSITWKNIKWSLTLVQMRTLDLTYHKPTVQLKPGFSTALQIFMPCRKPKHASYSYSSLPISSGPNLGAAGPKSCFCRAYSQCL